MPKDHEIGEEVAILPHACAAANEVQEILTLPEVGPVIIVLEDGREFGTATGVGINTNESIADTEDTEVYRAALNAKEGKAQPT